MLFQDNETKKQLDRGNLIYEKHILNQKQEEDGELTHVLEDIIL